MTSQGKTSVPGIVPASSRTFSASLSPWKVSASCAPSRAQDCAIAQAMRDEGASLGGTDNTPPFRFRRWMYAQTGLDSQLFVDDIAPRLLEHVPEYLRRNPVTARNRRLQKHDIKGERRVFALGAPRDASTDGARESQKDV